MTSYRCDRCGKLYSQDEAIEADNSEIFVMDKIAFKKKDLCKGCNALLNEWWQDGEYIRELAEKWRKKEGDSND